MATLPLAIRIDPAASVDEQLQKVMLDLALCAEYSWSSPEQVGYRVDNLLATQYDFPGYEKTVPALHTSHFENSDFPLSLLVEDNAQFRLLYDEQSHSPSDMNTLSKDFLKSLRALCQRTRMEDCILPSTGQPKLSAPKDVGRSIDDAAKQFGSQPVAKTLSAAFEASVAVHSKLTALEALESCWTYEELDNFASSIACAIQRRNLQPGPVAIYADGSAYWIAGVLGILKAGRAYCPVDPVYPTERQASVYKRSCSSALLVPTSAQAKELTRSLPESKMLTIEDLINRIDDATKYSPTPVDPTCDALIVYTSGTTGEPKGVPISHQGLLALQSNPEATMFSRPGLRIAQYMSPAFDYCANEIFSALLHGATLVLRDPCDPNEHLKRVDVATITPSVLGVLDPSEYPNMRTVSCCQK